MPCEYVKASCCRKYVCKATLPKTKIQNRNLNGTPCVDEEPDCSVYRKIKVSGERVVKL